MLRSIRTMACLATSLGLSVLVAAPSYACPEYLFSAQAAAQQSAVDLILADHPEVGAEEILFRGMVVTDAVHGSILRDGMDPNGSAQGVLYFSPTFEIANLFAENARELSQLQGIFAEVAPGASAEGAQIVIYAVRAPIADAGIWRRENGHRFALGVISPEDILAAFIERKGSTRQEFPFRYQRLPLAD